MSINPNPGGSDSFNTAAFGPDGSVKQAGIVPASLANNIASTDPSAFRLGASGLVEGGLNAAKQWAGKVFNFDFKKNQNGDPIGPEADWRVRISMQPAIAGRFYSESNFITRPLVRTNGVIFPYTPTVSISHNARYSSQPLTHSNYAPHFYESSEVANIDISGEFTVQNIEEGQYLMAAVQFFRSCTKMFFGPDDIAGTPPPLVFLDGYGSAYLPHVPCVVTGFKHTMPADVDYLDVPVGISNPTQGSGKVAQSTAGISTRLPTTSTVSVVLQPVYSQTNIGNNFSLNNYAQGKLIQRPNGPIGGFL